MNVLDPAINKTAFTEKEDQLIIDSYMQYGSKWSLIAKKL